MNYHTTGNLDDTPSINTEGWKQIAITSQSLDTFQWELVCDERWTDPKQASYDCHRITRRAEALGGFLYSVATHIAPTDKTISPSVAESLIFVPTNKAA